MLTPTSPRRLLLLLALPKATICLLEPSPKEKSAKWNLWAHHMRWTSLHPLYLLVPEAALDWKTWFMLFLIYPSIKLTIIHLELQHNPIRPQCNLLLECNPIQREFINHCRIYLQFKLYPFHRQLLRAVLFSSPMTVNFLREIEFAFLAKCNTPQDFSSRQCF